MSDTETPTPTPAGWALSGLDPAFRDETDTYNDLLRSTEPVHQDQEFDRVVLIRAADIESILNDRAPGKDRRKSRPGRFVRAIQRIDEKYQPGMLFADDPVNACATWYLRHLTNSRPTPCGLDNSLFLVRR